MNTHNAELPNLARGVEARKCHQAGAFLKQSDALFCASLRFLLQKHKKDTEQVAKSRKNLMLWHVELSVFTLILFQRMKHQMRKWQTKHVCEVVLLGSSLDATLSHRTGTQSPTVFGPASPNYKTHDQKIFRIAHMGRFGVAKQN